MEPEVETVKKPGLGQLLKNRNFSAVFLGGLISDIGSNFAFIAIMFLAISFTSDLSLEASAQKVALILVIQIIPTLIMGPFAGVLVDRFDRKKIMAYADIMGAMSSFSVLLASSMTHLYIVSFFSSMTRIFFYPARGASIPRIVEPDQLVQANGITQTMTQLSALIGPGIAGVVIYNYGFDLAFIIDGTSFFLSGLMILTIRTNLKPKSEGVISVKQLTVDMKTGLKLITEDRVISYILALFLVLLLGIGMVNPLLAFYLSSSFGLSEQDFGFVVSFSAITGFIGAILLTVRGQIKKKLTMITSSSFILAISLALLGFAPSSSAPLIFLYISMAFIGIINISINIPLSALFQAIVDDKNLGKMNAFMGTALALAQVIGASTAAYLAGFIPISTILIAVGAFTGIVGVVSFTYLRRSGLEYIAQVREAERIEILKKERELQNQKDQQDDRFVPVSEEALPTA